MPNIVLATKQSSMNEKANAIVSWMVVVIINIYLMLNIIQINEGQVKDYAGSLGLQI